MSKYRPRKRELPCTMVDTREYSMRTYTSFTSGECDDYAPVAGSQTCSYCGTRYYLTAGDRMNCTQCGAPL